MGACVSKFGTQASEEGIPPSKEEEYCTGAGNKSERPREVGSSVEEEKKIVVDESSTEEKKKDWGKDEVKRRSLSILFKEVFSGILFKENDAADEKKPLAVEPKKSQDEKPEVVIPGEPTGGVEKTEKSGVEDEKTEKSGVEDEKTEKSGVEDEKTEKFGVGVQKTEKSEVEVEVNIVESDEPKATSQYLKKEPEPEPEIKVVPPVPAPEVTASETDQPKITGDEDSKK